MEVVYITSVQILLSRTHSHCRKYLYAFLYFPCLESLLESILLVTKWLLSSPRTYNIIPSLGRNPKVPFYQDNQPQIQNLRQGTLVPVVLDMTLLGYLRISELRQINCISVYPNPDSESPIFSGEIPTAQQSLVLGNSEIPVVKHYTDF